MLELILILALGQATDTPSVQRQDVQAEGTSPARPDGIAPVPEIDLGEISDSFGRRRPKPQPDEVKPHVPRRTWGEWWRSKDRPVWGGFKNMIGGAFNGVAFYLEGPYFIVKILGGLLTLGFCAVGAWFVVNVSQLFKRNKE